MAVNFSASNAPEQLHLARPPEIRRAYLSSPKALRRPDFYKRYWCQQPCDYNGIALSPPDENEFWIFNQYAGPRGSAVGADDGRWQTRLGRFRIKTVTAVTSKPISIVLSQNIPNPFNPSTTIRFTLAKRDHARVVVYDSSGRALRTLRTKSSDKGMHDPP
jgi:hypothetical protein